MVNEVLVCFGTRPEWLKVKPIVEKLDNCKLLFTGQHKDLLKGVEVDYKIDIGESTNRLDQILTDCLLQFPNEEFKYIMVHGDTVSGFACALAAYSRKIKIIHIEAGLRSFDINAPYPEEGYRQMISRIASINLAPTELSRKNLLEEKASGKIFVVGNSVLDNIKHLQHSTSYDNKILVTLHRWENHDIMADWFSTIESIANEYSQFEFFIPLHHHPNVQKHRDIFKKVNILPALPHNELIALMSKCKFVISDSGGIQEEGTFLDKKVIVCRESTERPEGIQSGHLHLCPSPELLKELFIYISSNYYIDNSKVDGCVYGNGNTGELIKKILEDE